MRDSRMRAAPLPIPGARPPASPPARLRIHPGYALATLACMSALTWISSRPRPAGGDGSLLLDHWWSLAHVPAFAGLTCLFLRALSAGRRLREAPAAARALAPFALGAFAALDEWHQSIVPGRSASLIDIALDLTGIGLVLAAAHLAALLKEAP